MIVLSDPHHLRIMTVIKDFLNAELSIYPSTQELWKFQTTRFQRTRELNHASP